MAILLRLPRTKAGFSSEFSEVESPILNSRTGSGVSMDGGNEGLMGGGKAGVDLVTTMAKERQGAGGCYGTGRRSRNRQRS